MHTQPPTQSLVQIIYISNSAHFDDHAQLELLLASSQKNNADYGITGMLLYYRGLFLQVLEGPEDKVNTLLNNIQKDKRHRACRVLFKSILQQREFAGWSMHYPGNDGESQFLFNDFLDKLFCVDVNAGTEAQKLMYKFRERALLMQLEVA